MFVIGIPTLNEADNISRLVKQIDEYAVNLGKEIIIINSDSKSKFSIFINLEKKCDWWNIFQYV